MSAAGAAARVRVLDAALATAALLLLLRLDPAGPPRPHGAGLGVLLAVGFFVADAYPLHLDRRGQTVTMSLSELPLVVGLLVLRPDVLVAARLLGAAVSLTAKRRQPREKLVFNLASYAFESTLAVTVFLAVPHHRSATLAGTGLAVVLAATAAALSTSGAVTLVVRLATGRWDPQAVRGLLRTGLLGLLVSCSVGLLVVTAVRASVGALVPATVVALALCAAYRAHVGLRHRHDNLALLYAFTASIDPGASYGRRLRELLLRSRDALRGGSAELVLLGPDGASRHRVDAGGRLVSTEPDDSDRALVDLVTTAGACRVRRGRPDSSAAGRHAALRGWRDCVVVPLPLTGGETGLLVVADRVSDVATYTPDDVRLLGSVAAQVSQALVGGQLLDRLTRESRHDGLTGLANRTTFTERLHSAAAEEAAFAVLLMDLDRFKDVNDTLGHHHGDLLIREVASRLQTAAPAGATVARLGGDEFAILLPGLDADSAPAVARELAAAVSRPCWIDGVSLDVQSSTGIALCPAHGRDPSVLLRRADTAMYAAKSAHSSVDLYEVHRDEHSTRRLELASRLRTAAAGGELVLEYQPQVDVAAGTVVGVEALMRWHHPELGVVPPAEFIPLAEQSGAIAELSAWALREAVGQAARWRDAGSPLQVSVNLSMRNLVDASVTGLLAGLLREHRLDPGLVTVEVTESQIMADPERTARTLQTLSRLGVGISIDDFGTGYSSLAYLRQLPVDEIKIDRSFMDGLTAGDQQGAIVQAVIDLARSLGMRVVAEGVEDLPTLRRLHAMGCGRAQGFLFSRSVPAAEVLPWVAAQAPLLRRQVAGRRLHLPTQRGAVAVVG